MQYDDEELKPIFTLLIIASIAFWPVIQSALLAIAVRDRFEGKLLLCF
jgi:hypothetical protein